MGKGQYRTPTHQPIEACHLSLNSENCGYKSTNSSYTVTIKSDVKKEGESFKGTTKIYMLPNKTISKFQCIGKLGNISEKIKFLQ